MYKNIEPFGHHIYGKTLGRVWLALVKAILDHGYHSFDEGRGRLDLQNVRVKSETQIVPDSLIKKYGNSENLSAMLNLTFNEEEMYDFDVVPSFPPGADSYYKRIQEGKMINFVVKRLSMFPESKKAVIVFPNYKDYKAVLAAPKDDYLPCIVSIQFRLLHYGKGFIMNTIFNARSIDAFQKSHGNITAIALLSKEIAKKLEKNLCKPVKIGPLNGIITDAHIYDETIEDAKKVLQKAKEDGN